MKDLLKSVTEVINESSNSGNKNLSHADAVKKLKAGESVVYDSYHSKDDMKSIMTKIKAEVPGAWVTRSPSSNNWKIFPESASH
ncbi:hypothetical protein AU106_gp098 [Sinorhizobium phage phiM9]|uniref:Uncharacterized protein n=1 Tax=Sinorhizobium phage phiM9 TaxID=1636182 RepID=A0A0F6TH39_9CAUD|nr:hypothetical protein AU106_gp098 [Sinorhizobium phage phiM9]AKE44729.1 hypothetical protein Sm_phiM9_101 [Sinorhizobium phage phiM9]